jgi:hypothetical protein
VVALRNEVGPALFADTMPLTYVVDENNETALNEAAFPFCVLTQGKRELDKLPKANPGTTWTEWVPVTFNVLATSRSTAEGIVDQLEAIFLPVDGDSPTLTMCNRTHLATLPGESSLDLGDDTQGDVWVGTLELKFYLGRG